MEKRNGVLKVDMDDRLWNRNVPSMCMIIVLHLPNENENAPFYNDYMQLYSGGCGCAVLLY